MIEHWVLHILMDYGKQYDKEKFIYWAKTLDKAIGNPLYHWSYLELQRYFGFEGHLTEANAEEVWELCNEKLKSPEMSARNIIINSNVELLCTTDDPIDSLEWHRLLRWESFPVKVLPTFRPDKAVDINKDGFVEYVNKLAEVTGRKISSYSDLMHSLKERVDFFHETGCIVADHGLDYIIYEPATEWEVNDIFQNKISGEEISELDIRKYKTALLKDLSKLYTEKGWVMQFLRQSFIH